MGVWFSANFYGHYFAGKIAKLTSASNGEANVFTEGIFGDVVNLITGLQGDIVAAGGENLQQLYAYTSVYASFGVISILVGIIALICAPIIKKLMSGIH
jgi:POT family proton-dependent oligopeptide transporter